MKIWIFVFESERFLTKIRHGSEQGNTFLCSTSYHFLRNSCFDRLL